MEDELFYKIFDAYIDVFDEPFPMMEYGTKTKSEMYDMMRNCIASNTPAHELYKVNMEVDY